MIIAHRGASAYAPENTLAAFQLAYEMGASWIELDVMLSADEEWVVFHDKEVSRTTNGQGRVAALPYAALAALDAGSWFSARFAGERIPRLLDVAKWLAGHTDLHVNIEIKSASRHRPLLLETLLALIEEAWPAHAPPPLYSSFDHDVLFALAQLHPQSQRGLAIKSWDDHHPLLAQQLGCVSIHAGEKYLTAEDVDEINGYGYQAFAYTVNSKQRATQLMDWGVQGIFSDYPDLLKYTIPD